MCWLVTLGALLFAVRRRDDSLLLRVDDADVVGKWLLGSDLAEGIVRQHDFDFDAKDT